MKIHPSDEVLETLLLSLDRGTEKAFRHLIWCGYCRSRLLYLPRRQEETETVQPGRYDRAFDEGRRALEEWEAVLAEERENAPGLFVELLERPAVERDGLLAGDPRFHTWGVLELLVERSLEVGPHDPEHGEELGRLALYLAGRLDAARYGAERIGDLRARSWAHVANARRIRSDLRGAEEAFQRAWADLEKGTGDLLERAILLDLNASLRRDQRRFEEALTLLRRAVVIFLDLGERHLAGRSLVKVSTVLNFSGKPEEGIPVLTQAMDLIDADTEPRLLMCARHNLVFVLADAGRFQEAQRLYRETRSLYRSFPDAWTQNRRRWAKAKIAAGLGQPGQAEALFLAAREGFMAEGIPYDTALVSLELALLYAGQGRTAELKRLAAEMLPVFASRHIHREALAALAFFQQAVEAEQADAATVAKVVDFLRKAQFSPELAFGGPDQA